MRSLSWLMMLVLLIAATLQAGCHGPDAGRRITPPPTVPPEVVLPPVVSPEVEAFFRDARADSAERLSAGDQIVIEVRAVSDTIVNVLREVPADGRVPLPRIGTELEVIGRTPQELEAAVAEAYASQHEDPYVTVTVAQRARRSVYVIGALDKPGRYDVGAGESLTVLKAITLAGGPTEAARLDRITIFRFHPSEGREVSSPWLDIRSVMTGGSQVDNLPLLPGDTLVVPQGKKEFIYVLGEVEKPGPVRWYEGITVSKAVSEAGGFKKFAKTSQINVIRADGARFIFDFERMVRGAEDDVILGPGDIIDINEQWI